MGEQYWCNCHLINQQHLLSFTPLDCLNSHNSVENEYPWRNTCKYLNLHIRTLHNSQSEGIDQTKVFNFHPDAIQVIENVELQQLPETINREIVKNNCQEIVFEKKERGLERNLIKLHREKDKNHSQEIISKEDKDVLMQTAVERNMINKDKGEILTNNKKIIFEEEEKDISRCKQH
ncbi:unnamed protein product [Lasius platythorax]|uniref:Uncharacterized protein n=1 Tax=Lasius platythorax TaxID=488582 RepID=A0AAV2N2C5_9HYME